MNYPVKPTAPEHRPLSVVQHALEAAEEVLQLVGAGSSAEDVVVGGVQEVFVVQLADEAAGLAAGFLAVFQALGAIRHGELVLRAGDADV